MERYNTGSHQDPEAWHHVSGGLSTRSAGHEEAQAREAGPAVRCGVRGTDLHCDRVYESR